MTEEEKKMSPQMKYYYKKKAQDPEWYAKQKERLRESTLKRYHSSEDKRKTLLEKQKIYNLNRYKNDEQFREYEKSRALNRYYRKKAENASS